MERMALWETWSGPGLEHLRLVDLPGGILADGLTIGLRDGRPFRVRYTIHCDADWRVQEALIERLDDETALALRRDRAGHWIDAAGAPRDDLARCQTVALPFTPFSTTLAIQRLDLAAGQAADLAVIAIAFPDLSLGATVHRYHCLARHAAGARYRREAEDADDLSGEFSIDGDGLVVDFAGAFTRVWPV